MTAHPVRVRVSHGVQNVRSVCIRVSTTLAHHLDLRVHDGLIRKAIGEWPNAGAMKEGLAGVPESTQPAGEDDVVDVSQTGETLSVIPSHCLSVDLPRGTGGPSG